MPRNTVLTLTFICLFGILILFVPAIAGADLYFYDGQVDHDVKRDRIIAIAEDYATLHYYVAKKNIDASNCPNSICPDPVAGWKTGIVYCWGGDNTTSQFLYRLKEEDAVYGNKKTWSPTSYDSCSAGVDCSGFVSNTWTSPRMDTNEFWDISDSIDYEDLRMGDAINKNGHIRLFDYYVSNLETIMIYESTSGGGTLWKCVHRSLSRSSYFRGYTPIRYNHTYKVYDFPEPTISYIKKAGVERLLLRWDGQAQVGFRLYQSQNGTDWKLNRDEDDLTPSMRTCGVSGLLPDHTYYYRMSAVNSGGETGFSDVACWRNNGNAPSVLLVDGADRYREQHGHNHAFLTRLGKALGMCGAGFDFASNEAVVDEQIDMQNYHAAVWIIAEDSRFDETLSWPEQMHLTAFLKNGGRLFISGSDVAYDLDQNANSTTYKNGNPNDRPFYNDYLRAGYQSDDADTYHCSGVPGSPFEGMDIRFDDGAHGTYDVASPDVIEALGDAKPALTYIGGNGGTACVCDSSTTGGTIVNMAFGFETIYPEKTRNAVMKAILGFFDMPPPPPTIKSVKKLTSGTVQITWDGHASRGFRLFSKTPGQTWNLIQNEHQLGPDLRSVILEGIAPGVPHGFKLRAVNTTGESADSDVLCAMIEHDPKTVLIVDGYDRWNAQAAQSGGKNHTLVEKVAGSLYNNSIPFDSCTNESIVQKNVSLTSYTAVIWMCGEESTESETFSAAEQELLKNYLETGGNLFVSGAEIAWDLVHKASSANDYSNGSPGDAPFFRNYLKADYKDDDGGAYQANGAAGSIFEGTSLAFDDGAHGTYDVNAPDVLFASGGGVPCLRYSGGDDIAGIQYSGLFPEGEKEGRLVLFGFPVETIYDESSRTGVIERILRYFELVEEQTGTSWLAY